MYDAAVFSVEPIDATGRRALVGRLRIAGRSVRGLGIDHAPSTEASHRTDEIFLCALDASGAPVTVSVVDAWLPGDASSFGLTLPGDGTIEVAPGMWGPMGDSKIEIHLP